MAVHDALPDRYSLLATLGYGLGLRQGETFGLSPDDVDFLRGLVHVQRQVKLYGNGQQAFALPKLGKTRTVPLPDWVRDELAAYLVRWPARRVTLPWASLEGEPREVLLAVTTRESAACERNYINSQIWKPALRKCGVEPTRDAGSHILRHTWASVALEAGVSIREVSAYLGHADPGFSLRCYAHLMPQSEQRVQKLLSKAFEDQSQRVRDASEQTS